MQSSLFISYGILYLTKIFWKLIYIIIKYLNYANGIISSQNR